MKETYILNYRDKLNNFRDYVKEDLTRNSENCVDFLQNQIDEAKSKLTGLLNNQGEDLGDVLIRTISKDLSRYYESFRNYHRALSEMETGNLLLFRKKIVSKDKDFFINTWGEESGNFFRTRKFISTYLKDLSLAFKINSSLDCISSSLRRYILSKYGK